METDNPLSNALQECEEKVKQLEDENEHLRESSHAFGQLAERLNKTLQQERRAGIERRQSARASQGDRRHSQGVSITLPAGGAKRQE
jgi:predicted RNase H-like nuclease (RuvC/YqgF family)